MKKWIAAAFAFVCSVVMADMDRYGNVMLEDDGGGYSSISKGDIAMFFLVWTACSVILFLILDKHTKWGNMVNFHAAFFGGGFIALFGSGFYM